MLSTLNIQLINGLDGDPALYVQPNQSSDCLLIDAGSLDKLTNRELLKIRVLAVTHTHLDHFIGFDRLLRVNVPHFRTLEIIGPTGIVANVRGKLQGYSWNLLVPGQLNFVVHEINRAGKAEAFCLTNVNGFHPEPLDTYKDVPPGVSGQARSVKLTTNNDFEIKAVVVDHGIDVLAYYVSMPDSMVVSKQALDKLSVKPGPWISDLQKKAGTGNLSGSVDAFGVQLDAAMLASQILERRRGERFIYITDMVFSRENLARILGLSDFPVDLLVCESNYVRADRNKAISKCHLTTYQAALIAAAIGAKKLQIFHVSNIYGGDLELPQREAAEAFSELQFKDSKGLEAALSMEYV